MIVSHLPLIRLPSKLGHKLITLSEPSCTQWVAFADQTTAWVHHKLPAIGVVAGVYERPSASLRAETKSLVGDELVGGEAVVELDNLDVPGPQPGLVEELASGVLGHVETYGLDAGLLLQSRRQVC